MIVKSRYHKAAPSVQEDIDHFMVNYCIKDDLSNINSEGDITFSIEEMRGVLYEMYLEGYGDH